MASLCSLERVVRRWGEDGIKMGRLASDAHATHRPTARIDVDVAALVADNQIVDRAASNEADTMTRQKTEVARSASADILLQGRGELLAGGGVDDFVAEDAKVVEPATLLRSRVQGIQDDPIRRTERSDNVRRQNLGGSKDVRRGQKSRKSKEKKPCVHRVRSAAPDASKLSDRGWRKRTR